MSNFSVPPCSAKVARKCVSSLFCSNLVPSLDCVLMSSPSITHHHLRFLYVNFQIPPFQRFLFSSLQFLGCFCCNCEIICKQRLPTPRLLLSSCSSIVRDSRPIKTTRYQEQSFSVDQHFTRKGSVLPNIVLCPFVSVYLVLMICIRSSGTSRLLRHQYIMSVGTLTYTFSPPQNISLFFLSSLAFATW